MYIKVENERIVCVYADNIKDGLIEVQSIPEPEHRDGFLPVMYYRNGQIVYEYEQIPEVPTEEVPQEDKISMMRSATEEKVKAMFFAKHISEDINTFELTNKEALSVKEMFPKWEVGIDVKKGEKRHYLKDDKLYEADQDHKTQADWAPDIMTSLWHEVSEHEGTIDDPIPYNEEMNSLWQGMVLEEGKYYTQSGIKYKCTRNTGNKVTHNLSDLVGHFVELVV